MKNPFKVIGKGLKAWITWSDPEAKLRNEDEARYDAAKAAEKKKP